MTDDRQTLLFALQKYPERVEALPIERLVLDSARQNSKRPAYLKLAVPDDMVKTLRGRKESRDLLILVRVPRDVQDREGSRIVLPNEVG